MPFPLEEAAVSHCGKPRQHAHELVSLERSSQGVTAAPGVDIEPRNCPTAAPAVAPMHISNIPDGSPSQGRPPLAYPSWRPVASACTQQQRTREACIATVTGKWVLRPGLSRVHVFLDLPGFLLFIPNTKNEGQEESATESAIDWKDSERGDSALRSLGGPGRTNAGHNGAASSFRT